MSVPRRDVLAGGGEVRALARTVDWAATPMGAVETWPEHARTAVDLCLESGFPMMVCWGADLVQIYNDAHRRLLGGRHPAAMAQRGRDCWSDVWGVLGPLYERVMSRGESVFEEDLLLLLDRHGFVEESYFTLSISPIRDPSGGVAAALVTSAETTERVLEVRRLRIAGEVVTRSVAARTSREALAAAARVLSRNARDVPYALLYLIDAPGSGAQLAGWSGLTPGGRLAPERISISARNGSEDPWRLADLDRGGHVIRMEELPGVEAELPTGPWALAHREALVLPVAAPGQERFVGALVAGLSPARRLDDGYRAFFGMVTDAIGAALGAAQRHEDLRRRAETLANAVEARSRFMAGVSHELRTPLNAIVGHVDLLREGIVGPITGRQAQHIGRVRAAAVHLKGLIEEILAFSRFEVGAEDLHLGETNVGLLARELAELLEPLIRERGLRLGVRVPDDLRPIRTDAVKLRQILMNLLANAQKYTDTGGIELLVEQEPDGAVRASVTDTGPGIERADQDRIFEPFWRLPGSGERSGTGLGLTLARSLARLLGGDLHVRSEPGMGSTFTVRVPDLREASESERNSGHLTA